MDHEQAVPHQEKEASQGMSLNELGRVVKETPNFITGLKKGYCVSLSSALSTSTPNDVIYTDTDRNPSLGIRSFHQLGEFGWGDLLNNPEKREAYQILQEEYGNRRLAEIYLTAPNFTDVSFVFSIANSEGNLRFLEHFLNPQEIQYHGLYVGRLYENRLPIEEAKKDEKYAPTLVNADRVQEMIEGANKPIEECSDALANFYRLAENQQLNPTEIERVAQCIKEFATYIKREPVTEDELIREVGKCTLYPPVFKEFAKKWFGLDVGVDNYSWNAYDRPHRHGHDDDYYHQVNIFQDSIVIDWTAKQRNLPKPDAYPFVYAVGDPRTHYMGRPLSLSLKEERLAQQANKS